MFRPIAGGLAALFLALPLAAQGVSPMPSAQGAEALSPAMAAAKQRDEEAMQAFAQLQKQLEELIAPVMKDAGEEAQMKAFREGRKRLKEFVGEWDGTDAGLVALINIGMVNLYVLEEPDAGFEALEAAWTKSKARPQELLASSQVTPARAGLQLGEALMEAGRYDQATTVFTAVAREKGPEGERAKHQLEMLPKMAQLGIGKPVPAFEGAGLDGRSVTPEQYRGKVVLIDFWAIWCGPCRAEMPNVVAVYNEFHDQGFDIIGVSLDNANEAQKVRDFAKNNDMPWRQVYDGGGWNAAVAKQFAVDSIPATFLIDRSGIIRYKGLRGDALKAAVKRLLSENT